jgi:DNA-binding response OmpR family regulator
VTGQPGLILVADDDPDIVALVSAVLRRAGFDVVEASDGAEALELLRTRRPQLAVLDISMPKLDGMEVLRFMRAEPESSAVPVVLLSARAQEADVRDGYAQGASKYVRKPFSPRELVAVVRELLGF